MISADATTSTTCIIRAQDFSDSVADPNRTRWTGGKMRHVLAVLGDSPVIVTTDKQTGHTLVNVRLSGLRTGWAGCGYEVGIVDTYEGGPEGGRTMWHRLDDLGDTIIPLAADNAKWRALDSHRNEGSYAVELAQAQHGRREGREWGNWKSDVGFTEVAVTYTPYPATHSDFAPRGERGFWCYKLDEVAAQGLVRQQHMHDRYPTNYERPAHRSDTCSNNWHRGLFDFMTCSECPKG